ncbi:BTB/POZ and MATH domain-containing protein 4 [Glycine soja]|uniref:BTB/POZ and MATH domain-containing protein 4 n=1 Tax=Glycine soja TaxID=3848 RepID=A0A445FCV6_GLYSO|nr:BTB/POZ and MATH domain-containing protein 4 [Glycine soja]
MSHAMCNPAMVSRSVLGSQTSSKSVTETMSGSHEFVIKGYSLTKGMGIGKYIVSETFIVGGFQWAIYFFPDGRDPKDNAAYVSVFVALQSKSTNVRALFDLTLLDLCKKGEHKVHSHFSHSLTIGPYTLINHGSMWGYTRFFKRRHLETSIFLKDDCLKINCTIAVLVSSIDSSQLNTIQVPESDIGEHFGMLLEDEESFDVTFSALLHFVYRDTLLEDEELFMLDSSFFPSLSESFIAKLLAAGEKYGLPRLMLMCESILCKDISVDSVAYIFALADRYCATHLKSMCQKFSAENFDGEFPCLTFKPNSTFEFIANYFLASVMHSDG